MVVAEDTAWYLYLHLCSSNRSKGPPHSHGFAPPLNAQEIGREQKCGLCVGLHKPVGETTDLHTTYSVITGVTVV